MTALMCSWNVELGDRGKAVRSSRITGRANVQGGKDELIGGRGSNVSFFLSEKRNPRAEDHEEKGELK